MLFFCILLLFYSMQVFLFNFHRWFFPEMWMATSLLRPSGFFLVSWMFFCRAVIWMTLILSRISISLILFFLKRLVQGGWQQLVTLLQIPRLFHLFSKILEFFYHFAFFSIVCCNGKLPLNASYFLILNQITVIFLLEVFFHTCFSRWSLTKISSILQDSSQDSGQYQQCCSMDYLQQS